MPTATDSICVGRTSGFVFEANLSRCLCFVPAHLISWTENGKPRLRDTAYLLSGWARRNAISNPSVQVRLLFPNLDAPRPNAEDDDVRVFLHRLIPRPIAR